jgi:hypothetical protein
MNGFEEYAVWVLCGVSAYLGKKTLDNRDALAALELNVEKDFQRKEGLEATIRKAVDAAFVPMNAKLDQALEELETQRLDLNVILDKFEVPAAHRHGH